MTVLSSNAPDISSATAAASSAQSPHPDDPPNLHAALNDLQNKRLETLRLYHQERSLRQQETQRAAALTAQLNALSMSPSQIPTTIPTSTLTPPPPFSPTFTNNASLNSHNSQSHQPPNTSDSASKPSVIFHTDDFPAEVCSLERAMPVACPSLTWYSLSMSSALLRPPDVVALLHPLDPSEYPKPPMSASTPTPATPTAPIATPIETPIATPMAAPDTMEEDCTRLENGDNTMTEDATGETEMDMAGLHERVQRAEAEAREARQAVLESQRLIADLKEQLDASTAACKDLLDTVKEQEDTIAELS